MCNNQILSEKRLDAAFSCRVAFTEDILFDWTAHKWRQIRQISAWVLADTENHVPPIWPRGGVRQVHSAFHASGRTTNYIDASLLRLSSLIESKTE